MNTKGITDYIRNNVTRTEIISKSYSIQNGKIQRTSNPHLAQFYNSECKTIGLINKSTGGNLTKSGGVCTTITTFTDNLKRNFQKLIRQYSKKIQIISKSGELIILPERIITDTKEIDYKKGIVKKTRKIRELKTPHELDKEYPDYVQIYKLNGKPKYSEEIIEKTEEKYTSRKH